MKKTITQLMYKSLDSKLNAVEQEKLDAAVSSDPAVKKNLSELETMRSLIKDSATDGFKPMMVDRVMARLAQAAPLEAAGDDLLAALKTFFRPLAFTASLVFLTLLAYNIGSAGSLSLESLIGLPEVTVDNIAMAIQ